MVPSVLQTAWEVWAQTSSQRAAAVAVGVERSSLTRWFAADWASPKIVEGFLMLPPVEG